MRQIFGREPPFAASGEAVLRIDRAGEEADSKWAPADKADTELFAQGQNFGLGAARQH